MTSATPDPAAPSPEPPGLLGLPPGGRVPPDTLQRLDARGQRPRLTRPGPGPVWLAPPQLPPGPVVWLAVGGGPEREQVDRAIHLWGFAVDDGRAEPRPEAITADFEDHGGRHAWGRFVARAREIIERYPDARWVHFSPRERAAVRACAAACGAPAGFLERLEEMFFELLARGVRRAVRLPLESCSIRQAAAWAGFRWRSAPPGRAGALDPYQRARASADPVERARILRDIADSNANHLLAMRAVWRWMIEQGPKDHCG